MSGTCYWSYFKELAEWSWRFQVMLIFIGVLPSKLHQSLSVVLIMECWYFELHQWQVISYLITSLSKTLVCSTSNRQLSKVLHLYRLSCFQLCNDIFIIQLCLHYLSIKIMAGSLSSILVAVNNKVSYDVCIIILHDVFGFYNIPSFPAV